MAQRVALYVRVSSQEQVEGYSLDAQERAGLAYAAAHGWEITQVYRDEGRSARTDDLSRRPAFARMLADAEDHAFDVLIVHKLDRFARNIIVALDTLRRLDGYGVSFLSISEQIDFTTPIGKVMLSMLAAFAQYYSDNLSTETKKGKAERKRQGLWNGVLPYGCTTDTAGLPMRDQRPWACNLDSRSELHHGDGLELAFTLAAAGHSDRDIAQRLTAAGYRTTGNRGQNPFTKDTVRAILRNRFYLGELPDGEGGTVPGRHDAIIDPALFERVAGLRAKRGRLQSRTGARQPWALSGIAVCAGCGKPLRANGAYARCPTHVQGGACDQTMARIDRLVEQVANGLTQFAQLSPEDVRKYQSRITRVVQLEDQSALAQRRTLERRKGRLQELYLAGDVGREQYMQERDRIDAELAGLPEAIDTSVDRIQVTLNELGELAGLWREETPENQALLTRQLFRRLIVRDGAIVEAEPVPVFRAFFTENPTSEDAGSVLWRKRRGSITPAHTALPPFPVRWIASPVIHPQHRPALDAAAVERIRTREHDVPLRDLAARYGVSHETIRKARSRAT